jgi:hypothetical protein
LNARTARKIRKEINSKENEMVNQILEYFDSLPFFERLKIAVKIIRKKL